MCDLTRCSSFIRDLNSCYNENSVEIIKSPKSAYLGLFSWSPKKAVDAEAINKAFQGVSLNHLNVSKDELAFFCRNVGRNYDLELVRGPILEIANHVILERPTRQPLPNMGEDQSKLLASAKKTDTVALKTIEKSYGNFIVDGPSREFCYCMSNFSTTYRMADGLAAAIRNRPVSGGSAGLGLTSGVSLFTGYISACHGYIENAEASKVNDFWGMFCGKITMLRGFCESVGGAVFIPVRVLSIVEAQTGSKIGAHCASILGNIGSAVFGASFLLIAIPSAVSGVKGSRFLSELTVRCEGSEKEALQEGVAFMLNQLELSPEERKNIAEATLSKGGDGKSVVVNQKEERFLTEEDKSYINKASNNGDLRLCLKAAFINEKKCKEADLKRKAGSEVVGIVKDELKKPKKEQLLHRLSQEDSNTAVDDAKTFIDKIKSQTTFNVRFNAAVCAVCVIGAAAFFAGMFISGGTLGVVLAVVWVGVSLALLAIDGYGLWQAYKNEDLKFNDKVMMFIMGFFMTTSLIAGTVFSGGVIPLVAMGLIGTLWAGFSVYSYYRWSKDPEKTEEGKERCERVDLVRQVALEDCWDERKAG